MTARVAIAVALATWLSGCAPIVPQCPLGSYVRRADTDSTTTGGAGATGSLPAQTLDAKATWGGTKSVDWHCAPLCPKGTTLRASKTTQGETVECLPLKPVGP